MGPEAIIGRYLRSLSAMGNRLFTACPIIGIGMETAVNEVQILRLRRKLMLYLAGSIMLFVIAVNAGKPESFANFVGSAGMALFGIATAVLVWLLIRPPEFLKVTAPSQTIAREALCYRGLIGPEFPTGRSDEMVAYRGPRSLGQESSLSLFVEVPGVGGIQLLAEKIYWAMSETGNDFKHAKDNFHSSSALEEAESFLLLREIQAALSRLYENQTGKSADELYFFRLPEVNLRHGQN